MLLGPANTPGDTLVWLPNEHVLATGDIVVGPVPYMFNVYPAEMLKAFDRIRKFDFRVMIPGHGARQATHVYLDQLSNLVRDVREQIVTLVRQKLTLEQVQAKMDGTPYRQVFTHGDPWLGFWFDNYTWGPLVESAFHEARGDPLGPAPVQKVN